ncbi:MAG TPA: hypothetical protein VGC67_04140 [Cellulomonas sp.]
MDTLMVDLDGLTRLVEQVRAVASRLQDAPELERARVRHPGLDVTLGRFDERWERVLRQGVRDIDELARRLELAARCYQEMDRSLAQGSDLGAPR